MQVSEDTDRVKQVPVPMVKIMLSPINKMSREYDLHALCNEHLMKGYKEQKTLVTKVWTLQL